MNLQKRAYELWKDIENTGCNKTLTECSVLACILQEKLSVWELLQRNKKSGTDNYTYRRCDDPSEYRLTEGDTLKGSICDLTYIYKNGRIWWFNPKNISRPVYGDLIWVEDAQQEALRERMRTQQEPSK